MFREQPMSADINWKPTEASEIQPQCEKQPTINFEFSANYQASLYYAFDLLGAAQVVGRGRQVLETLRPKLQEDDLAFVKETWQLISERVATPEEQDKLSAAVYDERHNSIEEVEGAIQKVLGNEKLAKRIGKSMELLDPLIRSEYKANTLLSPEVFRVRLEKEGHLVETVELLNEFRNFVGEYAGPHTANVRVILAWQPKAETTNSSAFLPNTVIAGIRPNMDIPHVAGGLFHETAHLQFDAFGGKARETLIKHGFVGQDEKETDKVITDFNEGLVYLWHCEYFEIECLHEKKGRIEEQLTHPRWNLQHPAFALKLKPLVDRYREEGKSMDDEFFAQAKTSYDALRVEHPEYFEKKKWQ